MGSSTQVVKKGEQGTEDHMANLEKILFKEGKGSEKKTEKPPDYGEVLLKKDSRQSQK